MAVTYAHERAQAPWRDHRNGNAITWARDNDDTDTYRVDLADWLDASETCSSVTAVNVSGPTISAITVSGAGLLAVTVTAGSGFATARILTSASRRIDVPLQWRATDIRTRDRYAS